MNKKKNNNNNNNNILINQYNWDDWSSGVSLNFHNQFSTLFSFHRSIVKEIIRRSWYLQFQRKNYQIKKMGEKVVMIRKSRLIPKLLRKFSNMADEYICIGLDKEYQ